MTQALEKLFALTGQIAEEGVSLVPRVVPPDALFVQLEHYPKDDCIAPGNKSRWFYHAHPPEEREEGEHGHFHIFLPRHLFGDTKPLIGPPQKNVKGNKPAQVVHFAALAFGTDGMPSYWFTTNYWVTHEYMMPATEIAKYLKEFDMTDAPGDPLVNDWLTAAVQVFHDPLIEMLEERDKALTESNYTDKALEVTSRMDFDL
ncbi:hypothetical protein [Sphingorhabdus sp. Alg239-R122]|uniref:DUF6969 family protein n=1 Tax=Sphingorhabdus sp. Alg239-R122 TaxID=2305989 RepID=UPI0013DC703F|nr:hypothetical protein [Sphingorhabdus sp. Alg239-R122]